MDKKINLKKILNEEFFEPPVSRFKSLRIAKKFNFFNVKHEIKSPGIFVCNKTTLFDKALVSSALCGNFVFLKNDIISQIHNNSLSAKQKTALLKEIKELFKQGISVVVFPEKNYSIFGECEKLPQSVTEFLFETGLDLKYFYLIGTYFVWPIWSKNPRKCETRYSQQFKLENYELAEKSIERRNEIINNMMPSSASTYAQKFPVSIKGGALAENIDTLMFCCPKCKSFFSVYSEFNCLKCRNCGSFLEFSNDGKIMFSNEIESFDAIEPFLFKSLKNYEFSMKPIVCYNNIHFQKNDEIGKPVTIKNVEMEIYADKFILIVGDKTKHFLISDIKEFLFGHNNTLFVKAKKEEFSLHGENKENFFILIQLLKLYNSN